MNTKLNYLYRDADNYKTPNSIVIHGEMTDEDFKELREWSDSDGMFIPEQVGLPLERNWAYNPMVDTPYAELEDFALTDKEATVDISVLELISRFVTVNGNWDPNTVEYVEPQRCINEQQANVAEYSKDTAAAALPGKLTFDVNNSGTMELVQNLHDGPVQIVVKDGHESDNPDSSDERTLIPACDMVMLIDFYRYIKTNDIQHDFFNPFGRKQGQDSNFAGMEGGTM